MTSLLTNAVALATLRQMTATQKDLAQAQTQASTGLRVSSATDNAAYWSIGVAMRSQVGAVSSVNDGLALTSSIATVTTNALSAILTQMNGIKNALVAAQQAGVDSAAIDLDIKAKQQQIITIANSASFNGRNWLVDQVKVDETIDNTYTYDQSTSVVTRINNNVSPSTESYTLVTAAHASYTITDQFGATQSLERDKSATDTYTDTVTTSLGVTHRTGTHTSVSATDYAPTTGVSATATPITLVQGYDPSSGVSTATISRTPLLLFTNNSGTVRDTNTSVYSNATVDENLANYGTHQHVLSTSDSASYSTDTLGAAAGLLDQSISVSNSRAITASKVTLLTMTALDATDSDLATMLQKTDSAIVALTTAGSIMGALTTRMQSQTSFNIALSDALTSGVGALTDADMNTTATRMQALQTQQQLQTQALSIANQNNSMILKLFG